MKMKDWDTASFKSYRDVVDYFSLHEEFKSFFKKECYEFVLENSDKYFENAIINTCLNMIEADYDEVWFSGFNEATGEFDINKMIIEPKSRQEAMKIVEKLKLEFGK